MTLEHTDPMTGTLAQAAQGDHQAFAEIVRAHQSMVFSIAYHFLQNRALAEELAQDVFLELYQKLVTLESAEHVRYWLRRVAVHRCIDQSRRRRPEVGLDDAPEPGADAAVPDLLLEQQLRQSLAALPEKRRMVVILRYQEGMDLADIARVLNMPINTVKSTLQRSLLELRKKLTRKLGEVRYAFL